LFVALALIIADLRYLLLATGCISRMLLFAGAVYFPRWRSAFAIPWSAAEPDAEPGAVIIEGTPCPQAGYPQELVVLIQVKRVPELLATALVAVTTV
jgi:hypothetical protein